jgi:hypothetical protein
MPGTGNYEEFELQLKATGLENWKEVAQEVWKTHEATQALAGDETKGTGFAGVSKAAFQAERALGALATGTGLARVGPMLESLIGTIGGPAGIGFTVATLATAFERYIPQLIKHFHLFAEKTEEDAKRAAEAVKAYKAEVAKEEAQPTEEEKKAGGALGGIFAGKGRQEVRQGIEATLRKEGFGKTQEQVQAEDLERMGLSIGDKSMGMKPAEKAAFDKAQNEKIQERTVELMKELEKGSKAALDTISSMSKQNPLAFGRAAPGIFGATAEHERPVPNQFSDISDMDRMMGIESAYRNFTKPGILERDKKKYGKMLMDLMEMWKDPDETKKGTRAAVREDEDAFRKESTLRLDSTKDKQPRFATKEGMEQSEILQMINKGQKNLDSTLSLAAKSQGSIETLRETVDRQRLWLEVLHAQLKESQSGAQGVLQNLKNFQNQGGF